MSRRQKILLIIEDCNPRLASVPLEGFHYFNALSRVADVTLVTHARNREALAQVTSIQAHAFIAPPRFIEMYARVVSRWARQGVTNWALLRMLLYPAYESFNRAVYQRFASEVKSGVYDLVHAFTPIVPRYPYKIADACVSTPFVLGPVNGGLPYPPGFRHIARKEFDHFNVLRSVSSWVPGYTRTYARAAKILAGSSFTLKLLGEMFHLRDRRCELFYENGVASEFFAPPRPPTHRDPITILFAGRLVPLKCADLLIQAVSCLSPSLRERVHLTIVGDGPERPALEQLARARDISTQVHFAGWVAQRDTRLSYARADIFAFPSIREFGGAVVVEAMAAGLPCIVADYGCPAEYVAAETGFKVSVASPRALVADLVESLATLIQDEARRHAMSIAAVERARAFEWSYKAAHLIGIYERLLGA